MYALGVASPKGAADLSSGVRSGDPIFTFQWESSFPALLAKTGRIRAPR
jgi:hypothetical protein